MKVINRLIKGYSIIADYFLHSIFYVTVVLFGEKSCSTKSFFVSKCDAGIETFSIRSRERVILGKRGRGISFTKGFRTKYHVLGTENIGAYDLLQFFPSSSAFITANSELPDISTPNRTKIDQKSLKSEFNGEKMAYVNSEVAFMLGVRSTLIFWYRFQYENFAEL